MNKKIRIVLLLIFILLALAFWFFFLREDTTKEKIEWDEYSLNEADMKLDNPDRGFYTQIPIEEYERLEDVRKEGDRLVLLTIDLIDYSNIQIPQEKLDILSAALDEAKNQQIGIIFRAAYGFWGDCEEPSTKEGFAEHIEQLAQVLNEHSDTIVCVQAGMLGPYGEWHHGQYLTEDEEEEEANRSIRIYILEQWEKFLSEQMQVAVRRPRFIREAEEASVLVGRLAYHNDGLLASESDLGTFDDIEFSRDDELAWMDTALEEHMNGGEMPMVSEYTEAPNVDHEFAKMHVSYLNKGYNVEVLESWEAQQLNNQNAKAYIENHLGYRLFISNIKAQKYWKENKLHLEVELANSGYGVLPDGYQAYVCFTGSDAVMCYKLDLPDLHSISNGETATGYITLEIPEQFLLGEEGAEWKIGLKIGESMYSGQEEQWMKLANDNLENTGGFYRIATYEKEETLYKLRR